MDQIGAVPIFALFDCSSTRTLIANQLAQEVLKLICSCIVKSKQLFQRFQPSTFQLTFRWIVGSDDMRNETNDSMTVCCVYVISENGPPSTRHRVIASSDHTYHAATLITWPSEARKSQEVKSQGNKSGRKKLKKRQKRW